MKHKNKLTECGRKKCPAGNCHEKNADKVSGCCWKCEEFCPEFLEWFTEMDVESSPFCTKTDRDKSFRKKMIAKYKNELSIALL